jgi:two-component system, NarL family, sensor histidine kinase UhpB
MLLRLQLLLLLCIAIVNAYGQQRFTSTQDSLAFAKADTAFYMANKNNDSAMVLAKEAVAEAGQSKNKRTMGNAMNALGWTMMHRGNLDSAIHYLNEAWQLFSAAGTDDDLARVCINIAEVYTKQSNISTAIKYLMQADSICVRTNNKPFLTNVWRQVAIVYREAKDYKKSADYFKRAMNGFMELQDYVRYVSTGTSVSILYRNLELPDSSLAVLNRCLALAKEKGMVPYQVAMLEEHKAESYFQLKKYQDALAHYTNAYNIFEDINNKADLAFEAFAIGKTLVKLNRFADAEKYLHRSYSLSDTLKITNYQFDAAMELAALYRKTGNWQKGYEYLEKSNALKDSLDLADQISQTNELKEKFETQKKENEITLLKTQNQLSEAENRRTRLLQYIFILLFLASLAIGWLLLNRAKMKRKLNEQVLRNQIAGDLHDDIGSALSIIDINSRIAIAKKEDQAVMYEQLQKIQQYSSKTMDSMSDIVWSVNPRNDNLESVLVRVREFAADVCEPMNIQLDFHIDEGTDRILLDAAKRKNIFLLCKEAINNAVKYSGCRRLTVAAEKKRKEGVLITITDDGNGFDEQTVKKGNGLNNMQTRADHLHSVLAIDTARGKGTSIRLLLPPTL